MLKMSIVKSFIKLTQSLGSKSEREKTTVYLEPSLKAGFTSLLSEWKPQLKKEKVDITLADFSNVGLLYLKNALIKSDPGIAFHFAEKASEDVVKKYESLILENVNSGDKGEDISQLVDEFMKRKGENNGK
jgi:hypothetical protein